MGYLEQLQQHIRDSVLQINEPNTLRESDINELIDIIISASISPLDLDKYYFVNESLATDRDIKLLCVLLGKQKIWGHEKSVENFAKDEYFSDIEDLIIRANRNGKNIREYCSVHTKKGRTNVEFSTFCPNANLLLAFKHLQLRSDAQNKRHSLSWLGIKTVPPTNFQIGDYWYYEQETGINLSVEIAASVDELFQKYKGDLKIDNADTQNFMLDILCECIKWNYGFIAALPVIDFKIAAMKAACSYFVQSFIDAYHGVKDANRIAAIFAELIDTNKKESCDDENAAFMEKLMMVALFRLFNQFLCHFFSEPSGNTHIFNWAQQWIDIPYWIRYKINRCQFLRETADMRYRLQRFLLSAESFPESVDGDEDKFCTEFNEQIKTYENEINQLYPRTNMNNLLIFCDEQNRFVKAYIDDLMAFICNMCDENCSDKILCKAPHGKIQSSKLEQTPTSRSIRARRFIKIQSVIEVAIKCSKK